MPALVVWERLQIAGDDLRCIAILALLLRMIQISMVIFVAYHIINFNHKPSLYVETGCLANEEMYWIWYGAAIAGCIFTLSCGLIEACVEVAMFKVSGRGTPTTGTDDRNKFLVPLCKCNIVPMFICRAVGFTYAVVALTMTEQFCSCARNNMSDELFEQETMGKFSACPTDVRSWYNAMRVLVFTMACDTFVPAVAFIVVSRKRIYRCYRRMRPMKEKPLEEVERSWQLKCKRCCECSSLMTCYMCGGQKLTAGSYADVAIALTDFLADGGSLDIVPSDVAAALICLVNVQKQKQIDCKNALLEAGGIHAKDKNLWVRLWKQFVDPNTVMIKRQESMRGISTSLKNSLSLSVSPSNSTGDIETGGVNVQSKHEGKSFFPGDEEKEEVTAKAIPCRRESAPTPSLQPTETELEELRQMILSNKKSMQRIDYRLVHRDSSMAYEPTVSRLLSPENSFDCLVLGEGSRYCAVALAAYSWMMYLWTNKCTGCCELTGDSIYSACTCHPRCCCCSANENIIGADSCGWKQATVLKSLGIEESDILYANFSNDVGVNPYLIIRDKEWKTIVITIRGTLSFEDMISDVTISPLSLEEIGEQFGFDGRGEFCHSGMLSGAKWIYDDLKRHNYLDEAMEANPGFGLRIVGHSLGAGVAAMLGRILRQQYPNLYCLCFSPPGCVFSERTAKESKDYACSFVLHNDMVPRLSYDSLANLRNDLIETIARIKVPKHKVFDANIKFWNEDSLMDLSDNMLHNKDEIPSSEFYTEFEKFKAKQMERQEVRDCQVLTLPGRILQMVRTSTKLDHVPCSCLGSCMLSCAKCIVGCGLMHETKKYKVIWTNAEDLKGLVISSTMMVDHFPYNVARALDVAADSYGVIDHATDIHERDQMTKILFEGAEKDGDVDSFGVADQAAELDRTLDGAKKDS